MEKTDIHGNKYKDYVILNSDYIVFYPQYSYDRTNDKFIEDPICIPPKGIKK